MADFKIFERDTSATPPLAWFTILDDGTGNYRKATLQSIIDQVPQQDVTGDGFVDSLTWTEGTKRIGLTQDGANNFNIMLSGVAMQTELSTSAQRNNWNTAFGWGNHASEGYLTDFSGLPAATNSVRGGIKAAGASGAAAFGLQLTGDFLSVATGGGIKIAGGAVAIDLTGTANRIPMFDSLTSNIIDSVIHQDSLGRIGINTTSPIHELDVFRTGTNESAINIQNGEGNALLSVNQNGNFSIGTAIGSNLEINAGSSTSGDLIRIFNLPTTQPAISDALWNDNGTLKIS